MSHFNDFRGFTRNSPSPDSSYNRYYMPIVEEVSPPVSPNHEGAEDGSLIPHRILNNPQYQEYTAQIINLQSQYDFTKSRQLELIQKIHEYDDNNIPLDSNDGYGFTRRIYLENRRLLQNTQMPYIPLYNQPSDVHERPKTLQEIMFQVKLQQRIKNIKAKRYQRNQALANDNENKSIVWREKIEAFEKERALEFYKLQTVFFKTFPSMSKKLKEKEEPSTVSSVVPPLLLDSEQRKYQFISTNNKLNGIVIEQTIWSVSEREAFLKCYHAYGKKFAKYVPSLPRKDIHKIIEYYYLTKNKEEYKTNERCKKKMAAEGSSKKCNAKKANGESISKIKISSHVSENISNSSHSDLVNQSYLKKSLQDCETADPNIVAGSDDNFNMAISGSPLKDNSVCKPENSIHEWNSETDDGGNIPERDVQISDASNDGTYTSVLVNSEKIDPGNANFKMGDKIDGGKSMQTEQDLNKEISVIFTSSGVSRTNQGSSQSGSKSSTPEIAIQTNINQREESVYMGWRREDHTINKTKFYHGSGINKSMAIWGKPTSKISPIFRQDLNITNRSLQMSGQRFVREEQSWGVCTINQVDFPSTAPLGSGNNQTDITGRRNEEVSEEPNRVNHPVLIADSTRETEIEDDIYTPNPRAYCQRGSAVVMRELAATHSAGIVEESSHVRFKVDSSRKWTMNPEGAVCSYLAVRRGIGRRRVEPIRKPNIHASTNIQHGGEINKIPNKTNTPLEGETSGNEIISSSGIAMIPIARGIINPRDVPSNIGFLNTSSHGIYPKFQAGYLREIPHKSGNIRFNNEEAGFNEKTSIIYPRRISNAIQGIPSIKNPPGSVTQRMESSQSIRMSDQGNQYSHEGITNSFVSGTCMENQRRYTRQPNQARSEPENNIRNPDRVILNEESVIRNLSKCVIFPNNQIVSPAKRHQVLEPQKYISDGITEIPECIDLSVNSSRKNASETNFGKRGDPNLHTESELSTSGTQSASIGKDFLDNAIGIYLLTDQIKTEAISSVLKLNVGESAPENRNGLSLLSDVAASVEPYNPQQK